MRWCVFPVGSTCKTPSPCANAASPLSAEESAMQRRKMLNVRSSACTPAFRIMSITSSASFSCPFSWAQAIKARLNSEIKGVLDSFLFNFARSISTDAVAFNTFPILRFPLRTDGNGDSSLADIQTENGSALARSLAGSAECIGFIRDNSWFHEFRIRHVWQQLLHRYSCDPIPVENDLISYRTFCENPINENVPHKENVEHITKAKMPVNMVNYFRGFIQHYYLLLLSYVRHYSEIYGSHQDAGTTSSDE